MKYLPLLLLIFTTISLKAQIKEFGKIKLDEEKSITDLITESEKNLEGYRVQIFTGNARDRQKAEEIKKTIESELELKAYVEYQAPLVKVRVGNFIDKLEAITVREKLKKKFRNAYLVKVKQIELPVVKIEEQGNDEEIQIENLD